MLSAKHCQTSAPVQSRQATLECGCLTGSTACTAPRPSVWKTCARNLQILCINRIRRTFFYLIVQKLHAMPHVDAPSCVLSLDRPRPWARIASRFFGVLISRIVAVHRFEEHINGREYLIEVRPVDANRWRAYLVRLHDGPSALMPFYGDTPDEAARQLSNWLALAHRAGAQ